MTLKSLDNDPIILANDPMFSGSWRLPAIVLFENRPFPWVSGGFLERRIPRKNGNERYHQKNGQPGRTSFQ